MTRAWITFAAAVLVLGCKTGEEPVRGAHRGVEPTTVYQPRPERSEPPAETPTPAPPEVDIDLVETTEDEPERDLAAELNASLGSPTDCLRDFVSSSPTKIRVSVRAIVRPSGMIIQPSAYASGLSENARACIEERVSLVRLQPLNDTVSQTVSTVIEMDYEPAVVVQSDPGVPDPELRNVREPLPKRPEVAPSGRPIQEPTSRLISGGFDGGRPIQEQKSKKIKGPKPRPIDGYQVDENAQEWR